MKKLKIPTHLLIETIRGCNSRCIMCPHFLAEIELEVKNGRMSEENFEKIFNKFIPHVSKIKFVSLWGLGEPLLDKGLFEKIKYLKKHNFKNVAIATNADLMNEEKQTGLLESGIDTVICSIDGIDKKTHESIRRNTNFENIVKNVQSCIQKRNLGKYKTRFLIRMIRQKSNYQQWPQYVKYWKKYIDNTKRDDIIAFDVQSLGGVITKEKGSIDYNISCSDINKNMIIDFDGEVTLCCGDTQGGKRKLKVGNVLKEDPIAIFNNKTFRYYREMNINGLRGHLYLCRKCDVPDRKKERITTSFLKK